VRIMYEETAGTTIEISCDIQSTSTDLAFCTGERGFAATLAPLGAATPFVLQGGARATTSITASASTDVSAPSTVPSPAAAPTPVAASTAASLSTTGTASASVTAPPTRVSLVSTLTSATALSSLLNPPAPAASNGHTGPVAQRLVLVVIGFLSFIML
jgi:hypothetical protein